MDFSIEAIVDIQLNNKFTWYIFNKNVIHGNWIYHLKEDEPG